MSRRDPDDRAEDEAYEELAARDLLRGRDLAGVTLELLHRGDEVAVHAAGRRFAGTLVHAAGDLACLRTRLGTVDLHVGDATIWQVLTRHRRGGVGRGGPASFKARLGEHEAVGATLELGITSPDDALVARLAAVATDHVVVDEPSGSRWFIPLTRLVWVLPVLT
ncbi:MAG: hypothetical protein M3493_10595 [Actinomycetota bacterium]|jgi:hypothetical protein|nr:hypothetical protein [Euzebyaceae bacterium]MDQ3453128.1 hypothetical protein [Actinomycetota bacterium]